MFFSESYTFRAHILPALIAALPVGFLMFALLPGQPIFVNASFILLATFGGAYLLSLAVRGLGYKKQPDLWKSWDGPPTTRLLRHRRIPGDITLAPGLRLQVEEWAGYALPTREQEESCPTGADAKYEEVVASLREATRDQSKFPLVLDGNASYGFRRNVCGLRSVGGSIAFIAALLSWAILLLTVWGRPWPDPWWDVFISPDTTVVFRLVTVAVNTLLAWFWVFWVKPSWVKPAANTYAIRLLESVRELARGQ